MYPCVQDIFPSGQLDLARARQTDKHPKLPVVSTVDPLFRSNIGVITGISTRQPYGHAPCSQQQLGQIIGQSLLCHCGSEVAAVTVAPAAPQCSIQHSRLQEVAVSPSPNQIMVKRT